MANIQEDEKNKSCKCSIKILCLLRNTIIKRWKYHLQSTQFKSDLKSKTSDIQSILKSTKHIDSAYLIHKGNRNNVIDILCIYRMM